MSDFIEELLIVLSQSTRTVVALSLCFVCPLLILMAGDVLTADDEVANQGIYQPLLHAALQGIYWRYIAAAAFSFFTFGGVAISCYRKERKRLMHL